jgi:small-conductance mechanosensitive channel/CRP-like cAMP-binding protein
MTGALRLLPPFFLGLVLLAALFRVVPRAPRRRLRRSVILLLLYAFILLALFIARWASAEQVAGGLDYAAYTLELLLVINMAALALFDLLLHGMGWDYPDILHDLAVGAAYLVAAGWLMHRSGLNITSIVATSAVVTAVIGLSLQATLGNLVGGLALRADDSIREGDWVELENKSQGQVKQIRWRHTVIETRDWDMLIVPNAQLLGQTIRVLGRRDGEAVPHRMTLQFCVDFRFSPSQVIQVVDEALRSAPIAGVSAEPAPNCVCLDLARENRDSVALYGARYWLNDLAVDDGTSSRVRVRIHAALRRAQIPLAMPATAIFLSQDDSERVERKQKRERALYLDALQDVELFARLGTEEKAYLADMARPAPFCAGEIITRQGAAAHWLYVLTKGQAEVRVAGADGQARKVADLNAPSFFGEMALMTGSPREATVVAVSDVECLRLDKDDFKNLMDRRPEIAQDISAILAQRRVELLAAREDLDADAKKRQIVSERGQLLAAIRDFFGLRGEN